MSDKKFYKVNEGKMICGVCVGLAEHINLDVSLLRILWAALALFSASGFAWLYLICALILPTKPEEEA